MSDTPTPHITQQAAREMLAALRTFVIKAGLSGIFSDAEVDAARAAIARATGGEGV